MFFVGLEHLFTDLTGQFCVLGSGMDSAGVVAGGYLLQGEMAPPFSFCFCVKQPFKHQFLVAQKVADISLCSS